MIQLIVALLLLALISALGFRTGKKYSKIKSSASATFATNKENGWYEMDDSLVLLPQVRIPRGIIHFIGGFLAGSTVQVAYSSLLSKLSENGYLVVATPIPPVTLNHGEAAEMCLLAFARTYSKHLITLIGKENIENIPLIGLSHSLGGKLTTLNNIYQIKTPRYFRLAPPPLANVFLAFNNFGFKDALDLSTRQTKDIKKSQSDTQGESNNFGEFPRPFLSSDTSWSVSAGERTMTDSDLSARIRYRQRSTNNEADVLKPDDTRKDVRVGSSSVFDSVSDWINTNVPDGIIRDVLDQAQSRISQEIQNTEFNPSPEDVWRSIKSEYPVPYNYIVQFENDDIDQSSQLQSYLKENTKCRVAQLIVTSGNHLTPNILDLPTISSPEDSLAVEELTRKILNILFRATTELWDREKENIWTMQSLGLASSLANKDKTDLPSSKGLIDDERSFSNRKNIPNKTWLNNDILDKQWSKKPNPSYKADDDNQ